MQFKKKSGAIPGEALHPRIPIVCDDLYMGMVVQHCPCFLGTPFFKVQAFVRRYVSALINKQFYDYWVRFDCLITTVY